MRILDIYILEIVFKKIIEKLHFESCDRIDVTTDWYSQITADDWNEAIPEKCNITLGSLYDDIDEILELANNKERPCTYVDFDRVASILHYISEHNNPVSS